MKEEKKLELMINKSTYEEIIEQSKRIDEYINKIVRGLL